MPIEKVDNTDLTYYLVCYDRNGKEQDDGGGKLSDRVCKSIQDDPITDVFIMSHGWRGDIPAAKDQYNRWIQAMATCEADRKQIRELRKDSSRCSSGFHWPSQPWGDEEVGVGSGASFAAPGGQAARSKTRSRTTLTLYADRIADTPAARAALTTIFSSAARGHRPATSCRRTWPRPTGRSIGSPAWATAARVPRPATTASPSIPIPPTPSTPVAPARRRRSAAVASRACARRCGSCRSGR